MCIFIIIVGAVFISTVIIIVILIIIIITIVAIIIVAVIVTIITITIIINTTEKHYAIDRIPPSHDIPDVPNGKVIGMYAFAKNGLGNRDSSNADFATLDDVIINDLGGQLIANATKGDSYALLTRKGSSLLGGRVEIARMCCDE